MIDICGLRFVEVTSIVLKREMKNDLILEATIFLSLYVEHSQFLWGMFNQHQHDGLFVFESNVWTQPAIYKIQI